MFNGKNKDQRNEFCGFLSLTAAVGRLRIFYGSAEESKPLVMDTKLNVYGENEYSQNFNIELSIICIGRQIKRTKKNT